MQQPVVFLTPPLQLELQSSLHLSFVVVLPGHLRVLGRDLPLSVQLSLMHLRHVELEELVVVEVFAQNDMAFARLKMEEMVVEGVVVVELALVLKDLVEVVWF